MKIRIAAVIASAGLSSRMGRFKPLLPFGESSAVEMVINAFARNRIDPILVVGGYRFSDLQKVVTGTAGSCIYNSSYHRGMFSSFKCGISALPGDIHGFFAHPVDIPLISHKIVKRMIMAFEKEPDSVIYPCYKETSGRPVLIPGNLLQEILVSEENGGLRAALERHSGRFRFVKANHPGILWDMDKIADYQRLVEFLKKNPL